MHDVKLRRCDRMHPAYQEIRDRHYIPNKGAVGQQIHYLIYLEKEIVGIISGGSAAYAVGCRDEYFGINKDNRRIALNGIVDNTVFRLEKNIPNLGTQVLAMWRKQISHDWEEKYGVKVCGFETFIIETSYRKGSMYKADNWDYVGQTAGSTKMHLHGIEKQFLREQTEKKLVFCKWIKGGTLPTTYFPTWNRPKVIRNQLSIFDD
ncbi:MAG: DUF4338 domain-containing protein [Erysipelotrichaceae bacterium]|nr:DUF4338 domain-containing protein [Erysipelotrichaceae bacterium]